MRAARDEGDVRAGPGQRRSESASDAPGADNRYTHMTLPSKSTPPIPLMIVGPDTSIRKA